MLGFRVACRIVLVALLEPVLALPWWDWDDEADNNRKASLFDGDGLLGLLCPVIMVDRIVVRMFTLSCRGGGQVYRNTCNE